MQTPTDEDFRAIGFTGIARDYPRDEMALAMFAAWNGVTPEKLSPAMRYFPNAATAAAWGRVAMAARLITTPALSSPSPSTEQGVVKALEWDTFGRASSVVGTYEVMCIAQGGVFGLVLPGHGNRTFPCSHEGSEADCRAVAQSHFNDAIRSALSASHPPKESEAPEGWVLVPREPTKEMLVAGEDAIEEKRDYTQDSYSSYEVMTSSDFPAPCYRAMIAAAPTKGGK